MTEVEQHNAVAAQYTATGATRFDGNPFIEALPTLKGSKLELIDSLAHYPQRPTAATRKASSMIRLMELNQINDIVVPFPEYEQAVMAMTRMIRETYVARNPLSIVDRQRRLALATSSTTQLPFPSNWRSTGKGHLLISISGMGKTTLAHSFLLRYPSVIVHQRYKGTDLRCTQVPHLFLRVPHDATLRALCLQFFDEVDKLLGTNYRKEAIGLRFIAPMAAHMTRVAATLSLGFLIVDEVQNLKYATGRNAEFVLNLFSELIERGGISVLIIATPAVQPVIEGSVRNGRKLASAGQTVLRPMNRTDPQWELFCETYWDYTYTKNKPRLTKKILDAWHQVSAGNSAFAATAFGLAQQHAIGTTECIDEGAFLRASQLEMGFLQPAIEALNSGNPARLRQFDDLVFSEKFRALRSQLGIVDQPDQHPPIDEFDDIPRPDPASAPGSKPDKSQTRKYAAQDLPVEIPRELS